VICSAAVGSQLLGRGGVLQQLTRRFLEAALEVEMDAHLGYDKHDPAGRDGGNSRNGRRAKTLLTEVGSFAPVIVPKRVRRLGRVEDLVVSLSAKGLPHGRSAPVWPRCTGRRCPRTGSRSPIG
jgi:transposase-like protein